MEVVGDAVLAHRVQALIGVVPNFPQPGVRFRDVTPIVESDPDLFRAIVDRMIEIHRMRPPDSILCIESWGYVFGVPLAYRLGSRLCLARRPGKLPRDTIKEDFDMCYAQQKSLEIHRDAIRGGDEILVVDDVIASGGSALAAVKLAQRAGGACVGVTGLAGFDGGPFTHEIESQRIPIRVIARL